MQQQSTVFSEGTVHDIGVETIIAKMKFLNQILQLNALYHQNSFFAETDNIGTLDKAVHHVEERYDSKVKLNVCILQVKNCNFPIEAVIGKKT